MGLDTAHSPNADDITTLYWVMLFLAVVFAVAINLALIGVIARYRAARGREPVRLRGSGRIQARAAIPLGILALAVFVAGVVYTEKAREGPDEAEALHVRAVGQQWIWRYEYPGPEDTEATATGSSPEGGEDTQPASSSSQSFADTFSYYELVVPVDTTVAVEVDSTDVVHRWWVPALGGKFDAAPGHVNTTWFRADDVGTYDGQSAAFSGSSYATMRTRVRVVTEQEYQAWLAQQGTEIQAAQASVQAQLAAGEQSSKEQGQEQAAESEQQAAPDEGEEQQ